MELSSSQAAHVLLYSAAVRALPEIAISKHRHADFNPARLKRRQDGGTVETNTYDVLTWSTGGAYYANVTVGTPPQEQVVILDTGSSDLYFDSSTAATCQKTGLYSCRGGVFDHGASSSYKIVAESPAFNTSFGDGSSATGPFAEDVVGIGDVQISGVQFGVADEVDSTTGFAVGLMGLGYSENEASRRQYPNIPEVLASSGEINSRLYSIYLNDIDATSGSILFGGIDKSKFTAPLTTLNILPSLISNSVLQFVTTVTALSATVNSQDSTIFSGGTDSTEAYTNNDAALAVLLDTGSSAWSIPTNYFTQGILPLFTYVDPKSGLCDCKYRDGNDSLTVQFGGKVNIIVPARQFIVPVYDPLTNKPQYLDRAGKIQACSFMLVPSSPNGQGFLTLGDAVLRSMYVVFDLDNGQLSLAQASLDKGDAKPDIVAVSAGPNGVQKAMGSSSTLVPNSYSIEPAVSGGETFAASSVASTVGEATGMGAVPANARASEASSSGGSGGSGSGTAAASSSAAAAPRLVGGYATGGHATGGLGQSLGVTFGVVVVFGVLGGMLVL